MLIIAKRSMGVLPILRLAWRYLQARIKNKVNRLGN